MRFGKEVDINEISGYQTVNYLKVRIQNLTTAYWIHFFFFFFGQCILNLTFFMTIVNIRYNGGYRGPIVAEIVSNIELSY